MAAGTPRSTNNSTDSDPGPSQPLPGGAPAASLPAFGMGEALDTPVGTGVLGKQSRQRRLAALPQFLFQGDAADPGEDDDTADPDFRPGPAPAAPGPRPTKPLPGSAAAAAAAASLSGSVRSGRGFKGGPSRYRGVVWHKSNCKWEARIYEGGRQKFLGYYVEEEAAALAYDDYAVKLHGAGAKLNFPQRYPHLQCSVAARAQQQGRTAQGSYASPGEQRQWQWQAPGRPRSYPSPPFPAPAGATQYQPQPRSQPQPQEPCLGWPQEHCPAPGAAEAATSLRMPAQEPDSALGPAPAVGFRPYVPPGTPGSRPARPAGPDSRSVALRMLRAAAEAMEGGCDVLAGQGQQAVQQVPPPSSTKSSRYRGVSWSNSCHKWRAQVWKGSEVHHVGYYAREEDAARAFDEAVLRLRGPGAIINFPRSDYGVVADAEAAAEPQVAQQAQQPPSSPYMGVSWCTRQRGWVAEIWDGLQYLNLGLFATEADAARAYDLACLEQHGVDALTNFPLSCYDAELAAMTLAELAWDASSAGAEMEVSCAWDAGWEEEEALRRLHASRRSARSPRAARSPAAARSPTAAAASVAKEAGEAQQETEGEPWGHKTWEGLASASRDHAHLQPEQAQQAQQAEQLPEAPGTARRDVRSPMPGSPFSTHPQPSSPRAPSAAGAEGISPSVLHCPAAPEPPLGPQAVVPPLFVGSAGGAGVVGAAAAPAGVAGRGSGAAPAPQQQAHPYSHAGPHPHQHPHQALEHSHEPQLYQGRYRGASAYHGVSWDKRKHKWFSQIQQAGRRHFLGYFEHEADAGHAYDRAAVKLFGSHAQLNFPEKTARASQGQGRTTAPHAADAQSPHRGSPPLPALANNLPPRASSRGSDAVAAAAPQLPQLPQPQLVMSVPLSPAAVGAAAAAAVAMGHAGSGSLETPRTTDSQALPTWDSLPPGYSAHAAVHAALAPGQAPSPPPGVYGEGPAPATGAPHTEPGLLTRLAPLLGALRALVAEQSVPSAPSGLSEQRSGQLAPVAAHTAPHSAAHATWQHPSGAYSAAPGVLRGTQLWGSAAQQTQQERGGSWAPQPSAWADNAAHLLHAQAAAAAAAPAHASGLQASAAAPGARAAGAAPFTANHFPQGQLLDSASLSTLGQAMQLGCCSDHAAAALQAWQQLAAQQQQRQQQRQQLQQQLAVLQQLRQEQAGASLALALAAAGGVAGKRKEMERDGAQWQQQCVQQGQEQQAGEDWRAKRLNTGAAGFGGQAHLPFYT